MFVVIVVAYGDGDDCGGRVSALRFNTRQAAVEITDWLNSLIWIAEARLVLDAGIE